MSHIDKVIDADPHFVIDINTRNIRNVSQSKTTLVQYDHNSERFSFTLPRFVEGHDMLECNSIRVNYINIGTTTKTESKGAYEIKDLAVCEEDAEKVCCTWLISQNVTQNAGALQFLLRFSCVAEDGTIEYAWHTNPFTGISVSAGINNAEAIVEQYSDVLEQWKAELFSLSGKGVENINTTKAAALKEINDAKDTALNVIDEKMANYGEPIIVDDAISNTSTNPVQNKVIIEYVDKQIERVDTIPNIEGTDIEETCIKFTKMLYGTDKAESFLFFTDPHIGTLVRDYEAVTKKYVGIMKPYYDATPTTFVLNGGDTIHENRYAEEMCHRLAFVDGYMRKSFDRYYPTIGNHDDNSTPFASYGIEAEPFSNGTIRNLTLRQEENLYYSFDGANSKGYVLNSTDYTAKLRADKEMTAYRWEQVDWLANRLKEDDAENSFLLYHAGYTRYEADPTTGRTLSALSENVTKLCDAYNKGTTITLNEKEYDFTGCTGSVRFILSGHVHDANCVEVHNHIPVISTYDLQRKDGTFDLCLADFDNNVLRMVRVGDGNDRDVHLPSRDFNGEFFTVTTDFTNVILSNSSVNVREGTPYTNTLTIPYGYILSSVVVNMGGVDITTIAYSDGVISIDNVTDDITITITATEIPTNYTNLADTTSDDWLKNKGWDSANKVFKDTEYSIKNAVVTNYIPITMGDTLRFKGFDRNTGYSNCVPLLIYYDENKEYVTTQALRDSGAGTASGLPLSAVEDENGVTTHTILIQGKTNTQMTYLDICNRAKYVRISALRSAIIDEAIIVTVNEEIYPDDIPYTNQLDNAVFVEGSNVANVDTAEYGYVNGYVVDGDGGYDKVVGLTEGYVSTGFIPCPIGDLPLYVKGADWVTDDSVIEGSDKLKSVYCRIYTHNSLGSTVALDLNPTNITTQVIVEKLGDKYYRIIPYKQPWKINSETGKPYYYRLSLYGNINSEEGDELIITHGEPIE